METSDEKFYPIKGHASYYAIHPGDILGEELKERGISQKSFAESIGMQPSHLNALIHGARNFTPAVAAKVATGLSGITADYWMRMQKSYHSDVRRLKVRASSLVSGYHPQDAPAPALADPSAPYGGHLHLQVTIPVEDMEMLNRLAARLGWTVE
jgi:addiction module HigA family antidote